MEKEIKGRARAKKYKINPEIIDKIKIKKKARQEERKRVLGILKPIVQKHCIGTSVNCYNLYQEIKKEIEKENENN